MISFTMCVYMLYFEFCFFVLMAWIYSLYQTLNVRLICPTHVSGQLLHFTL
jgi:hypothetical protein